MPVETWRPIPGFEGYEASNLGRIRSWWTKRWTRRQTPRVLRGSVHQRPHEAGRRSVVIRRSPGEAVHVMVARLVCLAFHGEPGNGDQAAHLDGDHTNDRANNLAWKDAVANAADKWLHGTAAGSGYVNPPEDTSRQASVPGGPGRG